MIPYNSGYIARMSGLDLDNNPYAYPSEEYYEWQDGWYTADDDESEREYNDD